MKENLPVPLGYSDVKYITYYYLVRDHVKDVMRASRIHCMDDLLRSGSTWEVK